MIQLLKKGSFCLSRRVCRFKISSKQNMRPKFLGEIENSFDEPNEIKFETQAPMPEIKPILSRALDFNFFEEFQEEQQYEIKNPEFLPHDTPINYVFQQPGENIKYLKDLLEKLNLDKETLEYMNFIQKKMNKRLNDRITKEEIDIICQLLHFKMVNRSHYEGDLKLRTPIITVMGHVDHGKTTLLDYLKNSQVADAEEGGITQRIGGFMMELNDFKISLIDTPGHAIFSNMRKTGAMLTDYVIVIISAIEGIQPQTKEVLDLVSKYQIPIIIAANKIDRNGANIEQLLEDLIDEGIDLADFGGSIEVVGISAKTGEEMDMFTNILVEDLKKFGIKGYYDTMPECIVIESREQIDTLTSEAILDKNFMSSKKNDQKICSVVVKNGILTNGCQLLFDDNKKSSRVTRMKNEKGHIVTKAYPGDIVEIIGMEELPRSGEVLIGASENISKQVLQIRNLYSEYLNLIKGRDDYSPAVKLAKFKNRRQRRKFYGNSNNTLKAFEEKKKEMISSINKEIDSSKILEYQKELKKIEKEITSLSTTKIGINPIIIRTNEQGKCDTIKSELEKIYSSKGGFTIDSIQTGNLTKADIEKAKEINARIMLIDVQNKDDFIEEIYNNKLKVKNYLMVNEFLDDLKILNEEGLERKKINEEKEAICDMEEKVLKGTCEIKMKFELNGGKAGGIVVTDGRIYRDGFYKVIRGGVPIADGLQIKSLKQFKVSVESLKKGEEGGIAFSKFDTIKAEDVIECYM